MSQRALGVPAVVVDPKRWTALLFIGLANLMVVLDATIVNIALPRAQADLGFSDGSRQWVITGYSLAFGGLLLLGGRISDLFGRRRTFLVGLAGFAVASALGGAAASTEVLLAARALQGVFGALLAPAALSLVGLSFTDPKERASAFGIYSAIAGAGGAVGLLLGGALTEYVDWRWCLYVNVAFAVVALVGGVASIAGRDERRRARLDLPGTVLGTTGITALVYGFSAAESGGWTSGITLGVFALSVVLLVAFVVVERRVAAPLLPLRVVTDPNRAGAYLGIGLVMIGAFAQFLFLAYWFQLVKGYSPVVSGLAFLPHIAGLIVGTTVIATRLSGRVSPRALMVPGLLTAAAGMALLTQLSVDSSYLLLVLPATVLLGVGIGTAFMPAVALATTGVRPSDAGIASAMLSTCQQVGGSIGTALLNTIAASATASWLATGAAAGGMAGGAAANEAAVHGYVTAFWWALGIMLLAAALVAALVTQRPTADDSVDADADADADAGAVPAPALAH